MAEPQRFEEQGGVATMDPPAPLRWISSQVMRRVIDPRRLARRRRKAEAARHRAGLPHVVEYFHEVDDGYSALAAQLLEPLTRRYDVEVVCHLVEGPTGRNAPEPELLLDLARRDAAAVAPHYEVRFPADAVAPAPPAVEVANAVLTRVLADDGDFAGAACALGQVLFAPGAPGLDELADRHGSATAEAVSHQLSRGVERRAALKHYSGGMFYYAGEWYWGIDRFYHLENRLRALGAQRDDSALIAPRPAIESGPLTDDGSLKLEFYPSLRSPYTSLIYNATVQLARNVGVELVVKPVLPMVMRGVPATREKGMYIFSDAAREAAALGLDWGHFYDPIGEPARRCYSLYPWAVSQGRGTELLGAFLQAAFFDGVNTNTTRGLRHVVEIAGLSWADAATRVGNQGWEAELEANRLTMYDFGCWGVPSYRLLDASGESRLALWGQDRLWLVSREIQRRLQERGSRTA